MQEKKENRERRSEVKNLIPKIDDKLKQIQEARKALDKYDNASINPLRGTGAIQGIFPTLSEDGQAVQIPVFELQFVFQWMNELVHYHVETSKEHWQLSVLSFLLHATGSHNTKS